ncbi:hypothetical protein Afe04nite_53780 [Asanoa ferruginea]|nr:hypothetical protein Afe04nite_53780 [Asanoa ferruginea]
MAPSTGVQATVANPSAWVIERLVTWLGSAANAEVDDTNGAKLAASKAERAMTVDRRRFMNPPGWGDPGGNC